MDFESLRPPASYRQSGPVTREQLGRPCQCSVCEVGRHSGLTYTNFRTQMSDPVGRPPIQTPMAEPKPIKICESCLSPWGTGQTHKCTRTSKRKNTEQLVRSSSPKTRERIVSSLLKETCKEQGVAEGGSVSLATGGTSLSVTVGGPKQKPAPKFSNESLNQLQLKMGASDNKMNVLGNYLRINCGRDSVSKMDSHMTE